MCSYTEFWQPKMANTNRSLRQSPSCKMTKTKRKKAKAESVIRSFCCTQIWALPADELCRRSTRRFKFSMKTGICSISGQTTSLLPRCTRNPSDLRFQSPSQLDLVHSLVPSKLKCHGFIGTKGSGRAAPLQLWATSIATTVQQAIQGPRVPGHQKLMS